MPTHKDYRQYFALFSIYLIISLTFFTANALAAINYRISGEDLVNKWRKADDATIFYTNASANVSIETAPGHWESMINCVEHANNSVTCEYILDKNLLLPTVGDVIWKLREETQPQRIVNATIKVDRLPPTIEKLNITQIGSALKVSYSIKDHSFQNRLDCAGLNYISYVVGTEADTIDFNTTVCEYNGTVMFNESGFYQEDFPITITAYDRLQQSVSNTTTMLVDLMGPDIQDEWQIMRGGQVIDILSGDTNAPTIKYDVVVYIQDPQLNINRVHADLSGLNINPVIKNTLKNKQALCILETEGMYKCTFSEIPIKPINADINIKVSAYDKSNNFANETLPKTVTILNDAGQVTYIGPLKEHCTSSLSKCYTAPESQSFIAEIGLGSNFSALIFGFNADTKVGPCFPKEDKWECVYRYNVPDIMQLKVSVSALSTDIYGNRLTYTDRNVVVDSDSPMIIGNVTSNLPNCAVASDTLELSVIAKESLSEELKIHVDTSELTGTDQTNGTCEKTVNDEWSCTLSISGFVTEHPPEIRKLIVEDLAGNKAEKDFKFEVCAEDANAAPNYITKINPDNDIKIDRRTASLLPIKTYVPLTITKSSAATIIEMTVDNCFAIDPDDETSEVAVLDSGHYFIDNTLVLYAGFDGAVLPEDEFEINCTVNSRMRAGNKVFLKPEQDSFIIKVTPYNNPLGVLDSAVDDKINREKTAIRDLESEIKTRSTINSLVNTVCTIAQIFVKINRLLQILKSALYAVCLVLELFGIGDDIWQAVGTQLSNIDRQIQKHLWPTNLLSANVYAYAIKATCLLYTCRHYSVDGLIEIGFTASTIVGALDFNKRENALTAKLGEGTLSDDGTTFTSKDGKTKYTKTVDANGKETWTNTANSNDVLTYNPTTGEWSSALSLPEHVGFKSINGKTYLITKEGFVMTLDETGQRWVYIDPTTLPLEAQFQLNANQLPPALAGGNTIPMGTFIPGVNGKSYVKTPEGLIMTMDENGKWIFVSSTSLPADVQLQLAGIPLPTANTPPGNTPPPVKKTIEGKEYTVTTDKNGNTVYIDSNNKKFTGNMNNGVLTLVPVPVVPQLPKYHTISGYGGSDVKLTLNKDGLYVGEANGFTFVYDPATKNVWRTSDTYGDPNSVWVDLNPTTPTRNTDPSVLKIQNVGSRRVYAYSGDPDPDYYRIQYNPTSQTFHTYINNNYIQVYRSATKTNGEYTYSLNPPGSSGSGNAIADITGYATNFDDGLGMDDIDYGTQQYADRNRALYTALESETWIVNPYRSTHWDDLCFPAVLYNLEKEKQIRCKYVGCLEAQSAAGMPTFVCDREYGMESCLYLDSAQWHVTGGGFWDNVGAGLLKSGLAAIVGIGTYAIYSGTCSAYLNDDGSPKSILIDWPAVGCGLGGTLLQLNEITAIFSQNYWDTFIGGNIPKDPAEIKDYCQGIDLNE